MRIINKKYLLIIILVGIILTGVIILKPKEEVQLDNVILKQEVNNKTFAMYKEEGKSYVPIEGTKFPEGYVLNVSESKCIDNNGNELENVLSYENNKVVIEGSNTTYCYLYFDKSIGLEILDKEETPKGLMKDAERGAMYRFQGQAKDAEGNELVDNYICFGTSDKEECVKDTDHYMYRIIGIEAETGRVKVIKKEALEKEYQWYENYHDDIKLPETNFFKAINDQDFLTNQEYVPKGWEEKISDNTWLYGDNNTLKMNSEIMQQGEYLYDIESGNKSTKWYVKSTLEEGGIPSAIQWENNDKYPQGTTLYYKEKNEKWINTIEAKVSLMYLHDYNYSVGDEAKCDFSYGEIEYSKCKLGWIHLIQNDNSVLREHELTMSRYGWSIWHGAFRNLAVSGVGSISNTLFIEPCSVRPVFFINASEELLSGTGTITDPFIIK